MEANNNLQYRLAVEAMRKTSVKEHPISLVERAFLSSKQFELERFKQFKYLLEGVILSKGLEK
ncbi:MAG: hypothetical protein MRY83_23670 [Flavobacteriales bacterium]|nr:hypothetical protein [Flavobacteriales bacterium]